jgi:hypothetical protein
MDLGQAGFAMGYNVEECYDFVKSYSTSPKPSKKFIMKILEGIMEEMK